MLQKYLTISIFLTCHRQSRCIFFKNQRSSFLVPDNLTFNIYFTSNLCLISITQKRHFPKLLGKCPKVQNLMKLNSPYAVKHAYFSIITHYYKQICCNFVAKSNYNISEITYFRYYSMIVATRPDPTVRPPSRIANVRPWLIAIG